MLERTIKILISNLFIPTLCLSIMLLSTGCQFSNSHSAKVNEGLESKYDLPSESEVVQWSKAQPCLKSPLATDVQHCLQRAGFAPHLRLQEGLQLCQKNTSGFQEYQQALCMTEGKKVFFHGLRDITQADFNWCIDHNELANCLQIFSQMGVLIHQSTTEILLSCQLLNGNSGIEKCLHDTGNLPKHQMTIEDEFLCRVQAPDDQLVCLKNRGAIPDELTNTDHAMCELQMTNGDFKSVTQCLRAKALIPCCQIGGPEISSCLRVSGEEGMDLCLRASGFND